MSKKNKKVKNRPSRFMIGLFLGEEKEYFIENIAMLLGSGTSISAALVGIKSEVRSRAMKEVIGYLEEDIENGVPLWKALENTGMMNESTISLIRVGESSGRLPENLKIIGTQQQKERVFQSKVRSAMMYPALVLSLTAVVGIGIAWFILPKLATVFSQMHIKLPWITKTLIQFEMFLSKYGLIVVPLFIAFIVALVYVIFFAKRTRFIGQAILYKFVGIRTLIQQIELARFGYVLGTLLDAGLPLIDALQSLENSTSLVAFKNFYHQLRERTEEGNTFRISFQTIRNSNRYIPIPIQEMIGSAERSGRLSATLISIGAIYEEKVDSTTKNVATIIEPVLLVIVWLGVVSVALAVILPIYQLVGDLNTDPNVTTPPPVSETVQSNQESLNNSQQEVLDQSSDEPKLEETSFEENTEKLPSDTKRNQDKIIIQPVPTGYVNVRERPTTASKAIGKVYPGDELVILGQQDGWIQINLIDGQTGWVLGSFTMMIEE